MINVLNKVKKNPGLKIGHFGLPYASVVSTSINGFTQRLGLDNENSVMQFIDLA